VTLAELDERADHVLRALQFHDRRAGSIRKGSRRGGALT
jgi:hypothetical protein